MKKKIEEEENEKKYFDPEKYNTLFVGADNKEKPSEFTNLIDLLISSGNYELKKEALNKIKEHNGLPILIAAIKNAQGKDFKHLLIASIWESAIDASPFLDFFVEIALNDDFSSSLEAITVIEEMQGPFEKNVLSGSIDLISKKNTDTSSVKYPLLQDLIEVLEERR